jgi:hypothetical protein
MFYLRTTNKKFTRQKFNNKNIKGDERISIQLMNDDNK